MLPLKIKSSRWRRSETVWIPTRYNEVPLWKIMRLPEFDDKPDDLVPFLLDLPGKISPDPFLPFLEWMSETIDLSDYKPSENIPSIRAASWGQKIQFHLEANKNTPLASMAWMVALYLRDDLTLIEKQTPEEIEINCQVWEKRCLDEVCPVYTNLIEQMKHLLKVENETLSRPPTPQQMEAGIDQFKRLGYMNSIDLIAGGDVLKYEAVLQIDYNTIYSKLLKLNISDKFTDKYREIINRK